MKRLAPFCPLLLVLLCLPAQGQDKKKATDPTTPDVVIHLPPVPPAPQPKPPAPGSAVLLPTGKLLLITGQVESFIKWTARDDSAISVKALKGPVVVYGDFVDPQPGDDDGRSIPDAYIYIIRAKIPGNGTLVVVPSGAKAAGAILTQPLDVGGIPPIPPNPITVSISPTSATVPVGGKQQFVAQVSQGGVKWSANGAGTVDQNGMFAAGPTAGTAAVVVTSLLDSAKTATATVTVTDKPPDPPAPIPAAGFRVLMVYDKNQLAKLPGAQRDVLYSQTVRAYLDGKVAKGADGLPEYRVYPDDEPMGLESDLWRTVMGRPRKSLPWIVISDGKTGTEQPLPGSVADTMTLLKKYGG